MSEVYPRIRIHAENGTLLLREGISISFFIRRPHAEVAHRVLRSLERYQRAVGPQALTLYPVDDDWETLDEAAWEQIRHKLLSSRVCLIRLSDSASSGHQYQFTYYGRPVGGPSERSYPRSVCALEFWLPTEFLEEHGPERVRQLALELAEPLPFCSGHVGLAFNGDLGVTGLSEELRKRCLRYLGIDFLQLGRLAMNLGTRIHGVSWMTFLGQPVLGELGGASALHSRLHSPDTSIHELDSERAVLTLGPRPEIGDTERGDTLPTYRELAQVLEPWLYQDERSASDTEQRWARRFLV
jgi:hypothetical protein